MDARIQRLFDIPNFIQKQFGNEHVVFMYSTSKGTVTVNAEQYLRRGNSFTGYLLKQGFQKGSRVISVISNSPECNFAELGILQAGGIHVPLSLFYTKRQLKEIFEIIQPRFVLATSGANLQRLQCVANESDLFPSFINLKTEPVFDFEYSENQIEKNKAEVSTDDTACILFTSGSTGNPKGVVLSHKNVLGSVTNFSRADIFRDCKKSISFLQLSLSGERKVNYSCQLNGISVCYPASTKTILQRINFFKADICALVPYLLYEFYSQLAFRDAIPSIRIICGGAGVSVRMLNSFDETGVKIFEVYGLTETASLLAYNTIQHSKRGTVGKVASNIQLSFSTEGEILVKGDSVMQGYLFNKSLLDKARDADGWFHTGDVGALDQSGFLKIIGRVKNIFKNSRGLYVHPEEIEQELMANSPFEQVIILGENANTLSVVLKLKQNVYRNADSKHKDITRIIRLFNKNKGDDLKITRYAVLGNRGGDGVNFVSLKTDRSKIADKAQTGKLLKFIAVD